MVTICKQDGHFIFKVNGMHRLWAFKSELTIPFENITNAHLDLESLKEGKGLRMPGTFIPSIITAGTFYNHGKKIFWDVSNMENAVIIDLKDEDYTQLIIEVENPAEAIKTLTEKE